MKLRTLVIFSVLSLAASGAHAQSASERREAREFQQQMAQYYSQLATQVPQARQQNQFGAQQGAGNPFGSFSPGGAAQFNQLQNLSQQPELSDFQTQLFQQFVQEQNNVQFKYDRKNGDYFTWVKKPERLFNNIPKRQIRN